MSAEIRDEDLVDLYFGMNDPGAIGICERLFSLVERTKRMDVSLRLLGEDLQAKFGGYNLAMSILRAKVQYLFDGLDGFVTSVIRECADRAS